LAHGTIKSGEARADASAEVAQTSTRAISTRLISIAIQRIATRRAFLHVTSRTAVPSVADASNVLHGIPRSAVDTTSLSGEQLLRPACAAVIAIVGAQGALAGNAIVSGEAGACSSGAVACSLVGALHPRV